MVFAESSLGYCIGNLLSRVIFFKYLFQKKKQFLQTDNSKKDVFPSLFIAFPLKPFPSSREPTLVYRTSHEKLGNSRL